ncbi:MAG: molybdenum cofactor biosynthesis protein MoaE [Gammaproteobacteria bacterium]|jgi:molybdopterin synthase catalytic subunit|nr:molybdenum cofactor biosynthesis protein MoaE [Gammaproteobacteria bacterium]MDH3507259.1 molybdenum cofactor biosynthesis protein MoaE [Gammaproteobacteria bacterium]
MSFRISTHALDPGRLKDQLSADAAGACACFEGWVRNHNDSKSVRALEYEAHEGLAVKEGEKILAEAIEKFDLHAAAAEHRAGTLEIGDCAVWVGVSSSHRDAAFSACRYIIDELKSRLPIWKKEYYADGHSGWINCVTGQPTAPE